MINIYIYENIQVVSHGKYSVLCNLGAQAKQFLYGKKGCIN